MRKRLFSILLAQCMVLCLMPTMAFAEDSMEETAVCTCEMACTEETMNTECPVCGAEGALAENCGKHVEPAAEGEASQPEGEELQENQDSDMPDTQSEAALAQVSGEGENSIAVQSAGVAIDNTNFPDANFRTIVEDFDTNNDSSLSDTEIAAVKKINCFRKRITNLKGIEYFTSLNNLWCAENKLTALDVSKNTALTDLYCSRNQLTTLDVSKNTALTDLDCGYNQLTTLDVSKNTALTYLSCGYNQLTTLDVSKNTALTYLSCRNNQLTTLDVSKNTALTKLSCDNNQLTSLDVSNTDMDDLNCYDNIYQIVVGNDRTFDLSLLPGNFDVSKTSDWSGGKVSGNTLTVDSDKDTVAYKYDCGKGKSVTFTLKCVQSADYANVDAAITKANNLNKDDYKDFSGVDSAVNAVVRGKNITEQSEVDAMAKAIEDAIAALQYKDADYTKVDEAIAKANALNKDDYKDFSGVEAAVNAVVRGKNITEQSEVDAMAKAIEDAIAALQYKGADYTKVDEAIAKANALNKDEYKDFSGVEAAVNAVVRGKNITEQSEVDAMAKAIEDAIAALQYKGADYTKVDEAIAKANALNKDDYKDFTGVEAAINAVVRGKNITEQSEVDAMAKAIEDAIAALQYKDADYTKVDDAIAKANALNKDDYKDFSGVEAAVNAVVRGKNITEQSEVDAMAKAIEDAIAALQYKGADYTKVDEAIAKANALNKDDYKDFSAVEAAINAVVRGKNITEQSEVDAMAKAIEDAIAALQYKGADYTKVDEAIAKANALNKDDYKDFSGVEAAVNAVVRGKNITEQSEVDAMAKAIEDAIAALQYKGADYTKVDEAIAKANALNKDDYKDFSGVEAAVNAVVRGKNITEQSEVDAMAKAIEDAIAALQYKDADYTKVDEAIAKANALNKDDYKDFSGVEAAVNAVVRGKNITEQSEVDAMAKAIEDAIAALQYKEKPKICKGGKEVKISNGAHEMRIHGKSYGTFTFAWVNDKAGWSIQNADGKYLSFDNGKLVLRDTAYVWKYDAKFYTTTEEKTSSGCGWWGWWGRPSTKVTNWYLVGDGTDLSISKSDTNADVKLYDAMESTEHSFGKWTPAEDGKHTRTCTICGATETGDCTYENGACTVCGALDPDNASVSVSATVTKRTSGGGGWWWWNRPTTTTWEARITATGTGVDIDKVEYSDDGKHYLTGTSFTSDTEITKFYIRVTDSKGNVTNWLYENGKVTQK